MPEGLAGLNAPFQGIGVEITLAGCNYYEIVFPRFSTQECRNVTL